MRMRRFLLLVAAGTVLVPAAVGCEDDVWCPGDHVITTAKQLEQERICTQIEGDLTITGSGLTDLESLSRLHEVRGCLRIKGNDTLRSLNGLSGLTTVGNCVEISDNDRLLDTGLSSLTNIPGNLVISFNESLGSLAGLASITSVKGSVDIEYNPSLKDLAGLDSLREVKAGIVISDNDSLTTLVALLHLQQAPGGDVTIAFNRELADCEANSFRDWLLSAQFKGDIVIKGNAADKTCP
jgi:hypothetical protein